MKGLIHLYTGDGKGKTTAALGLALRAAGAGRRVVLLQFMKGRYTAELKSLACLPQITVLRNSKDFGFYKRMSEQDKAEITRMHNANLARAIELCGEDGLLILDEICSAYGHELVDRAAVQNYVLHKPEGVELVMTGRSPDAWLTERADYITEMQKVRHPFDLGVAAREGIEF